MDFSSCKSCMNIIKVHSFFESYRVARVYEFTSTASWIVAFRDCCFYLIEVKRKGKNPLQIPWLTPAMEYIFWLDKVNQNR